MLNEVERVKYSVIGADFQSHYDVNDGTVFLGIFNHAIRRYNERHGYSYDCRVAADAIVEALRSIPNCRKVMSHFVRQGHKLTVLDKRNGLVAFLTFSSDGNETYIFTNSIMKYEGYTIWAEESNDLFVKIRADGTARRNPKEIQYRTKVKNKGTH